MKNIFRLISLASLFLATVSISSCSDNNDDNGKTPPPAGEITNKVTYDGVETELKSIVVEDAAVPDMTYILLSEEAGLTTFAKMTESDNNGYLHKFFMLGVASKEIANIQIDVMTEELASFLFANESGMASGLTTIETGSVEELSAGTIRIKTAGGKMNADIAFTLLDGKKLVIHSTCDYTIPEPPVTIPNEAVYSGSTTELKSMVVDSELESGTTYILLSADAGLTTFAEMTEQDDNGYLHKFFMLGVASKDIASTQIDVMTEAETPFLFVNESGIASDLTSIGTGSVEELSAGTIRIKTAGGVMNVDLAFTLTDNTVLTIHSTCDYTIPAIPTTNILTLDDQVKSIKGAFYEKTEEGTALYLTPANIPTAHDLENVDSYYTKLYAAAAAMTGESIDITTTATPFEFMLYFPISEERITITNNDLQGASGTFSMKETATGSYTVVFDIKLADYTVTADYDGQFIVYDISRPNGYAVDSGEVIALNSVVIDKSNPLLYAIYLSTAENMTTLEAIKNTNPIIVKANPANFDGYPLGFSGYEEVSITYDETTYNKEKHSLGNTTISPLDGDKIEIEFHLYSTEVNPEVLGYFNGSSVSVQ